MDEIFVGLIAGVAGLVIGALFGCAAINGSWVGDCDALGMHRHGKAVYTCKPQ